MNPKIFIDEVTSKNLREGKWKEVLTEYYALESVVEYNGAHQEPNVLDHVIRVYEALENIVKLEFLDNPERERIYEQLGQKIGKLTRKQLLFITALLHDIGKKDTLVKYPDGTTGCPWHELVIYTELSKFKDRFEWNEQDYHWVEKSILYHSFTHTQVENYMSSQDLKYVKLMKRILGEVLTDLLFFTYADTLGSDLRMLNSATFSKKEATILKLLNSA